MKLGLAAYEFRNGEVSFNLAQIERAMKSAQGKADLLCFGEAFLQGFDSLSWNYETDKDIAIERDSALMKELSAMTLQYGIDLLFGYLERDGETIYSSCAVLEQGKLSYNYRSVTKNWKEYSLTDHHYREGDETDGFSYRDRRITIALCGDLWICPKRFHSGDLLIWPVYVNFDVEEWKEQEPEYAKQAALACGKTLMVNSITRTPLSHGNAFFFQNGQVISKLLYDTEDILFVEL